jgi:hypothetical protein
VSTNEKTCTRCGETIPDVPTEGWVNKILLRKQGVRYRLRVNMWRLRWMPENPADQMRLTYTEFDLCPPCVRAVLAYAYGKGVVSE